MLKKILIKYEGMNIALKASIWFATCSIIQKGISVITLPIFTRIMTTEEFGRYSVLLSWYNAFVIFFTFNIHQETFNKGLSEHQEDRDSFVYAQTKLLILLSSFFALLYLFLNGWINKYLGMSPTIFYTMLLEILGTAIVGLWMARKRFEFKYKQVVFVTLTNTICSTILGIALVLLSSNKVEVKIISNTIIPVLLAVLFYIQSRKSAKNQVKCICWKATILSCIPLLPHYLSLVLLNQSDKIMIEYYSGSSNVALYSVAHTAGLLLTIITTSINASYVPWLYNKIRKNDTKSIKSITNGILLFVFAANICVIWIAPEIIKILAAPEYYQSIWCFAPIAMSVSFYFVYTIIVDVEIYYGKNYFIAIASCFAAAVNIILNILFIPKYGYTAAAYTTMVSYGLTMILHFVFYYFTIQTKKKIILFNKWYTLLLCLILIGLTLLASLLYNYFIIRLVIFICCIILAWMMRKKIINVLKEIRSK